MAHSNSVRATRKPRSDFRKGMGLHPDFPLFIHQNGSWCKKVKGKLHFFGGLKSDPKGEAAAKLWAEQKDALIAGLKPRSKASGLELGDLCNKFLSGKRTDVATGKLSPRTFVEYSRSAVVLVETFGRNRLVLDIRPDDFEKLYDRLAKKHGITTLGREVTMCRSVFKYAVESDLIDRAVKFGPRFKSLSKSDKRKQRAKRKHAEGDRMLEATEIRRMLELASPQLRAMVYLGINAGLGNSDCATLPVSALDLDGRWLDFPRVKTGIERRAKLWPETVAALQAVIAARRTPRDPEHAGLVFLTRLGQPWVRYGLVETPDENGKMKAKGAADDAISKETAKLLKVMGISRRGVNFYALRHSFETIAGGCRDQLAVDFAMGHADSSMAAEYRERIEDSRLQAVADHVRAWLKGAA